MSNSTVPPPLPDWAAEQISADDRVKAKIEELAARFGVIKLAETDRWWHAFDLATATLHYPLSSTAEGNRGARLCAEFADEAVAEARKRGRL
jgi:hypothetical protein